MSASQSAFFTRDTPCPACKRSSQQKHIRLRAVMPLHKESDQHVLEYKWSSPKIQQIHPPFYFLHFCPFCYYTDTVEDYETPDNSDYSRWSIKGYKDAQDNADPVLELLGRGVEYTDINFDSAMRIHLLAAYLQLLSPPDLLDSYKLGRIFLRIAWLYREQSISQAPSETPKTSPSPSDGEPSPNLKDLVLKGFSEAEQLVYGSASKWNGVDKAIMHDMESRFDEQTVPFKGSLDTVSESIDKLLLQVKAAKTAYLHHVTAEERSVEDRSSSTEYGMNDSSMIQKLKLMWPMTPSSEIEAMRTAVQYFEKSLSSDPRFDSMESYFRVASLSVDLLMRCGNIDSAFGFVRGIHSSCMETRQVYMNKLKEPDLKPDRKKKIQILIKRNNATLECALDLRGELMNKLVERERPRIEAIIKKHPNHSGKRIEEALLTAGMAAGVVNYIKDPKNKCDLATVLHRK